MDESISIVAVTKVTLGGRIHPPGAALVAPRPIAEELVAAGAARRLDAPAADPKSHGDAPPQDLTLARVSGIGPVTARELMAAGVADLAALAALTDEAVAALEVDEATQAKIHADWRAQAAALLRGEG